ncbi:hypothetical protein [Campylobacter corcagiensis]|uniref:Uncharacterized protein n=1 Tax=Campylobacter corcagiensis TaxID=1448857 RepID=A0A7M1LHF1_9BACT|nr:hypothetical protein [Campylobacter corcagiensis]QOQ86925.1 hypothetical protein IMC76_06850 [Campylobacter corcagiensis]
MKIKDFANPKIILFLSIAIPITLAYLKPCYGEYKREFSKEFLEQYDVNSLYEDLCESKWFYRFNNITPRNSNPKTIKKHRAFQKDLQATCQQEIWLLSKMLKDSKYTVSKVCGMSSNLTLQILQRKQDSMFGSSLMEVKN